jgi:MHS family proline/betaine transporter-like MFS transporter
VINNLSSLSRHYEKNMSLLSLWSACLGNFFEHYDTALFGLLSVFLAPLIFPGEDPMTALILTYAVIPLSMLARPFGALFFGYVGDIYGRQYALFLTLSGMSIVSGCIAFSPTYAQIGIMAPVIFCIGRTLQNFFISGETVGGAIYLLENIPEKQHDIGSGFYNATTIGGILCASAAISILYYYDIMHWGWRFLYLIGCVTACFGIILRKNISSSSQKKTARAEKQIPHLFAIFWRHRISFVLIAISAGFSSACYSISLLLMNAFIPLISITVTHKQMIYLNTLLLVMDFFMLLFFGWVSSKISREKVMLGASLGVIVCGIPFCMLLPHASLEGVIAIRTCLVLFGVAFSAPFNAWAQHLVPSAYRYSLISFAYAIGSQLLGGPTAVLSLWIFKKTGEPSSIAWYWVLLAIFSSVSLAISQRRYRLSAASPTPFEVEPFAKHS